MAFTNSRLVDVVMISPNRNSPRNHIIDTITIHCMAGQATALGCGNIFQPTSRQASSNYGVGYDGSVGLYVEEKDRSWCTSNAANDHRAVTIEVASDATGQCAVKTAAYNKTIELVADICKRNNIKRLVWSTDKNTRMNHLNGCNMTVHRDYANKSCPGDFLYARMGNIAASVNQLLATGTFLPGIPSVGLGDSTFGGIPNSSQTAYDAAMSGYLLPPVSDFKPYVATIDRSTPAIDFKKWQKNKIIGVVIEAGYLFDSIHLKQSTFKNPKIKDQVDAANEAGLPYGLYTTIRSRNLAEAEEEIEQLAIMIRTYPPSLGVWFRLGFNNSLATNESILTFYKDYCINKLGLKDQIGLYVTESDLKKKITWSKYYNDFYLWLINHVSSLQEFDGLLTPEFFMTQERRNSVGNSSSAGINI